jgi:ribosomal protein S18 acetylase RimI-like enzyme
MTSISVLDRQRSVPDGLSGFRPGRDLQEVISLLEAGFGDDLEARDRRWLADLSAVSGAGPLFTWLTWFVPPGNQAFKGFVWHVNGRLVGNASVMRSGEDLWIIANVVTHPDYRRRGIARGLMEAAIEAARASGARQIQLQVRADNAGAQQLYKRLGFWHMNAATALRLPNASESRRLGVPADGWTLVRTGSSTRARARKLLARAGEVNRGGPTGLVAQAIEHTGPLSRVDDWMQGRRRYAWAATAGGEFRGMIAAHGMRWRGPHRLDMVISPTWQGRVEATLVDVALTALSRHPTFDIEAEINASRPEAIDALVRAGFQTIRTLDRLALDLEA